MGFVKAEDIKNVMREVALVKSFMNGIENSKDCLSKAYMRKKLELAKGVIDYLESFCEEDADD